MRRLAQRPSCMFADARENVVIVYFFAARNLAAIFPGPLCSRACYNMTP